MAAAPGEGCCALWIPKKRRYCQFNAMDDGFCGHHKVGVLPAALARPHKKVQADQQTTTERRRVPVQWKQSADDLSLPESILGRRICSHSLGLELAEMVCEALELDPQQGTSAPEQLSKLHLLPEGQYAQTHVVGRHCPFTKRWTAATRRGEFRARLNDCMRRFVTIHVAEAVDATVHGWEHFIYQGEPSLRIHMPLTRPGIQKHKDFDYFHQPTEINFWVPLVPRVGGSNSLYCESAPGSGDFSPVEAELGQFMRFWGNQCEHYTLRNETDVTRVSIDLRVVPRELFHPAWASPKGRVAFRLGQYYVSTEHEVEVKGLDGVV